MLRVLAEGRSAEETEVRSVMTPDPVCINADVPLENAISRLKSNRFRRLIVVNHQQEFVQIVRFLGLCFTNKYGQPSPSVMVLTECPVFYP